MHRTEDMHVFSANYDMHSPPFFPPSAPLYLIKHSWGRCVVQRTCMCSAPTMTSMLCPRGTCPSTACHQRSHSRASQTCGSWMLTQGASNRVQRQETKGFTKKDTGMLPCVQTHVCLASQYWAAGVLGDSRLGTPAAVTALVSALHGRQSVSRQCHC
jgi:hypothetical protein